MRNLPWQAQVRFSLVAQRRVVGSPNLFSLWQSIRYTLSASWGGTPSHTTIDSTRYVALHLLKRNENLVWVSPEIMSGQYSRSKLDWDHCLLVSFSMFDYVQQFFFRINSSDHPFCNGTTLTRFSFFASVQHFFNSKLFATETTTRFNFFT